jgi:hypothetical protein
MGSVLRLIMSNCIELGEDVWAAPDKHAHGVL